MKAFTAARLVTFSFTWLADEEHRLSSRFDDDGAIRSMNKMLSIRLTGKAIRSGGKEERWLFSRDELRKRWTATDRPHRFLGDEPPLPVSLHLKSSVVAQCARRQNPKSANWRMVCILNWWLVFILFSWTSAFDYRSLVSREVKQSLYEVIIAWTQKDHSFPHLSEGIRNDSLIESLWEKIEQARLKRKFYRKKNRSLSNGSHGQSQVQMKNIMAYSVRTIWLSFTPHY